MSEARAAYSLKLDDNSAMLTGEPQGIVQVTRAELTDLKRQLVSLLVTVERALGEQPSVITRSERRRG